MNLVVDGPTAGTPSAAGATRVREAAPADRAFIVTMLRGLVATLPVPWRHPRRLRSACVAVVEGILHSGRSDAALLVAERCDGVPLGIALVVPATIGADRRRGLLVHTAAGGDVPTTQALEERARGWALSRGRVAWTVDALAAACPFASFERREPRAR